MFDLIHGICNLGIPTPPGILDAELVFHCFGLTTTRTLLSAFRGFHGLGESGNHGP